MKKRFSAWLTLSLGCLLIVGCEPAPKPVTPPPSTQAPPPAVQPAPASATPTAAAVPAAGDKGKVLLDTACNTSCHNLDRVSGYHEKTPWKDIVDRMVSKHGAKASTDEAALITEHLTKTYPIKPE